MPPDPPPAGVSKLSPRQFDFASAEYRLDNTLVTITGFITMHTCDEKMFLASGWLNCGPFAVLQLFYVDRIHGGKP